jgi:hypothetical protein
MRRGLVIGLVVAAGALLVALWLGGAPRAVPIVQFTPPPTATLPPGAKSLTVRSIPALLDALADNGLDEIIVADGTYPVSPAGEQQPDSLWIGARYASRTRPVVVRAKTRGGVTFDGGGATYFGGISFQDGAHDQTWDGFVFSGGRATDTGVVMFGGYKGLAAPHHITMRSIHLASTCTGVPPRDQGFYISNTDTDGPHDLLFEDITVDGAGGLTSAFAFGHDWGAAAHDVTVRRLTVTGTQQAFIMWSTPPLRSIVLDGAMIDRATKFAIRYETEGTAPAEGILIENVTSVRSGEQGFFSSDGPNPAGLTFRDNNLN